MLNRVLPLCLLALAVALFLGAARSLADKDKDVKADETTHEGTVVSVDKDKLTMTGTDKAEHSHAVPADAKVTLDGKDAKLTDLKKDMKVKVTLSGKDKDAKVTKVEASSK
jgi:hypothetical protein